MSGVGGQQRSCCLEITGLDGVGQFLVSLLPYLGNVDSPPAGEEDDADGSEADTEEEQEENDCAHDVGKEYSDRDEKDDAENEEEPEECSDKHDAKEERSNCDEKEASEDEEDPINDRVSKKSDMSRARNS